MNHSVISGEPVVQRKLGPVSLQGEKKRGDRKEGRQKCLEGRGGTEKGPLSVLKESKGTFFLPPPVALSNSISTEDQ